METATPHSDATAIESSLSLPQSLTPKTVMAEYVPIQVRYSHADTFGFPASVHALIVVDRNQLGDDAEDGTILVDVHDSPSS